MIIKGGAAGNVGWWGKHLQRDDTNERAEVMEIRGLVSENLNDALCEMKFVAAGSRSQGNFMYQANINPRADERLTPEQWTKAVDALERNLGLEGHQRVVVEHVKEGREHRHIVWNRVDVDTMKVADIRGNYRTHERTARQLEKEFDLTPTPAVSAIMRKPAAPELWEVRAAERTGIDIKQLTTELTGLWQASDSGKAFLNAVEDRGYLLIKGDRRDFMIIDQEGGEHSLARRLEGVKAADVRERMADVNPATLLSVSDARDVMREVAFNDRVAERLTRREATAVEGQIMQASQKAETPGAFVAALYREGVTFARVDAAGIESLAADQRAAFAEDRVSYDTKVVEGELVAVNRFGGVHRLNPQKIDMDALEAVLTVSKRDVAGLGAAREFIAQERAADRVAYEDKNAEFWTGYADRREARDAANMEAWKVEAQNDNAPEENAPAVEIGDVVEAGIKGGLVVAEALTATLSKLADFVADMFMSGGSQPQTNSQAAQLIQQRRALAALGNIRDSIRQDEPIRAEDLKNLTQKQLSNIHMRGDVALTEIIQRMDAEQERNRDRGRSYGRELER